MEDGNGHPPAAFPPSSILHSPSSSSGSPMLASPFFRRLFLPYLLLIVAATGTVGFLAATTVHRTYLERQAEAMRQSLRLVGPAVAPLLAPSPTPELAARVKEI